MKALYININGEDIKSSEDVIVVGTPEDNIVDKFYYELGKEIVKGVDIPGFRGLDKKEIVRGYKDIGEKSFDKITEQWIKVKDRLLSENPTGSETIELPMEYVKWLQNYGDISHTEIAKSLYARNRLVEISIDKIYRNAIGIIVNSIEPSECKDCKQFVVNDRCVTDDSAISLAIMEKVKGIVFVPYDDIVCSKCGKFQCECNSKTCPKCGKNPCECKKVKEWSTAEDIRNGNIILAGITLNKTSLKELRVKGISFHDFGPDYWSYLQEAHVNDFLSVYIPYCRYRELENVKSKHANVQSTIMDDDYFLNESKIVKSMTISSTFDDLEQLYIPFIREMGWSDDYDGFDYEHFVETLEEYGYTKIENPYDNNDDSDDTEFFISNKLDSKDWIIIGITTTDNVDDNDYYIDINFDVCFSNELVSYHTGEIIKRNV